MIVPTLATLIKNSTMVTGNVPHCFQTRESIYNAFLDRNLDGSHNSPTPFAQIFVSSKANYKVYTFKEMLLQPDKELLVNAMRGKYDKCLTKGYGK